MKLILLSAEFYEQYNGCPEILTKPTRPYVCVQVEVEGVLYAIPLRHHIAHKYAFMTGEESGLDYTKAVPILDRKYISPIQPRVDQNEYNMIKQSERKISKGMADYLKLYRKAVKYNYNIHYKNILKYSALKYFDVK